MEWLVLRDRTNENGLESKNTSRSKSRSKKNIVCYYCYKEGTLRQGKWKKIKIIGCS